MTTTDNTDNTDWDTRPERKRTDRHLLRIGQGEDAEDLLFDPGKILLSETLAMESAFNLTWPQIIAGVAVGRTSAVAAVVWVLRKRKNPKLRPAEVEFSMEDYENVDPDYLPEYGGLADGDAHGDAVRDLHGLELGKAAGDVAEGPKDSPTPETSSSEPED
jgi:hypothetical protein